MSEHHSQTVRPGHYGVNSLQPTLRCTPTAIDTLAGNWVAGLMTMYMYSIHTLHALHGTCVCVCVCRYMCINGDLYTSLPIVCTGTVNGGYVPLCQSIIPRLSESTVHTLLQPH